MKFSFIKHSRAGFTLVELLIGLTIFAIMSTMTMLIYFHVSEHSRRLQISREISETARQITEQIESEIKQSGIDITQKFNKAPNRESNRDWKEDHSVNYTSSGSNVLPIREGIFYVYGHKEQDGMKKCDSEEIKNTPDYHCGLYRATLKDQEYSYYNLVDAFIEGDNKKRVRITDLQFYIFGDENSAKKVTLNMELGLMPRDGVPRSLVNTSTMHIQTTFSERTLYK